MVDRGPSLPETRVVPLTRIRRERNLRTRGEMTATIGSKVDPLDVIARAIPPLQRRAISLTRVLGLREADVPKRLLKHAGDTVDAREIIIAKPINLGFQQLVYRSPGPGTIAAIQGSWMVLDLDGPAVDLTALYRGIVSTVTPRIGASIDGQGAVIQAAWGSGHEGYGVLRMMSQGPADLLEAGALDESVRGTVLVAGAGVTEEALRASVSLKAAGLISGGLDARLRAIAEDLGSCVVVTEGFGRVPMSAPIFELLSACNGQEAAVNGLMSLRGGNIRPEIFVPQVGPLPGETDSPPPPALLTVQPGARVRVVREPYLGRIATLPQELVMTWTSGDSGIQLPCIEVEFQDGQGPAGERAIVPWTNLELVD